MAATKTVELPQKNWHPLKMSKARVILVEDNTFTRVTLGDALTLHGFDVRAKVASAPDALEAQARHDPHSAILDLDLGIGPTGIDIAIALRKRNSRLGIVFLTTYKDPRLIRSDLPTPPVGSVYINKLELENITTLANQISLSILKPTAKRSFNLSRKSGISNLTDLQIEILQEIARGRSTFEVARSRGVSEQAIDKSISRISKHLGITKSADTNQRVQIARAYFEQKGLGL